MSAPSSHSGAEASTSALLRRALLLLAALALAGTAVELAAARHWDRLEQAIPFVSIAAAAGALWLIARRPRPGRIRLARWICAAVLASSAYGVWSHVASNQESGALDGRFSATWAGLPAARRWWLAASGGVGPSPPLAPGVLAQAALGLLAATIGHPALGAPDEGSDASAERRH